MRNISPSPFHFRSLYGLCYAKRETETEREEKKKRSFVSECTRRNYRLSGAYIVVYNGSVCYLN